jgi:hypothetical protein
MKKEVTLLLLILSIALTTATCDLDATLINQDPYPTVPGDYVKLVFQIEGIDSVECDDITFNLLAGYPVIFNPGESGLRTFKKIDYINDFETNILVPYEIRIDNSALDGANPVEVRFQSRGDAAQTKTFNIEIEDVRADFEVYVKDYEYSTNELTLEVLNIEAADVEALTIQIPKQQNIQVKGPNRIVVGDLDSNEYTTADFEATMENGEITIELIYSDTINTRRTLTKTLTFDSSYFTDRKADQKTTSKWTYIFWAAIIIIVVYWIYKRFKKKKKK